MPRTSKKFGDTTPVLTRSGSPRFEQVEVHLVKFDQRVEIGGRLIAVGEELLDRHAGVGAAGERRGLPDQDEPVALGVGQRLQEDSVDDAEDRRCSRRCRGPRVSTASSVNPAVLQQCARGGSGDRARVRRTWVGWSLLSPIDKSNQVPSPAVSFLQGIFKPGSACRQPCDRIRTEDCAETNSGIRARASAPVQFHVDAFGGARRIFGHVESRRRRRQNRRLARRRSAGTCASWRRRPSADTRSSADR